MVWAEKKIYFDMFGICSALAHQQWTVTDDDNNKMSHRVELRGKTTVSHTYIYSSIKMKICDL